jgi:hypothetical protein
MLLNSIKYNEKWAGLFGNTSWHIISESGSEEDLVGEL